MKWILISNVIGIMCLNFCGCASNSTVESNYLENTNHVVDMSNATKNDKQDNYKIEKVQTDESFSNYYYSPSSQNFFEEKNYILNDEMGIYNGYSTYLNFDNDIKSIGWFVNIQTNLSPKPIVWLDDKTVFLIERNDSPVIFKLLDIEKNEYSVVSYPEENEKRYGSLYYNCDINLEMKQMVFNIENNRMINTYIYDIKNDLWNKINSSIIKKDSTFYNCVWGINNNIFFDHVDNTNIIKKYNYNTGIIEDYIINGCILNISPNKRYLVYNDESIKKTMIIDLLDSNTYKIPYTKELQWNPLNEVEFSILLSDKIITYTIDKNNILSKEFDLSKILHDSDDVYNLIYMGNQVYFDTAVFDKEDSIVIGIENVTTYRINE